MSEATTGSAPRGLLHTDPRFVEQEVRQALMRFFAGMSSFSLASMIWVTQMTVSITACLYMSSEQAVASQLSGLAKASTLRSNTSAESRVIAACTPHGLSLITAGCAWQVETASESSTPRGAWESPAGELAAGRAPFAQQRPAAELSVPAWLSNWRLKLALSSQVTAVAVVVCTANLLGTRPFITAPYACCSKHIF